MLTIINVIPVTWAIKLSNYEKFDRIIIIFAILVTNGDLRLQVYGNETQGT